MILVTGGVFQHKLDFIYLTILSKTGLKKTKT